MSLEYDAEFSVSSIFDAASLASQDVADAGNAEFQELVANKVAEINVIFRLQPGINIISTFIDFNGTRYKVNISRA